MQRMQATTGSTFSMTTQLPSIYSSSEFCNSLLLLGFVKAILKNIISFFKIYGAEKWLSEIDWMIGDEKKSVVVKVARAFLKICWTVLSPGLILFVLVFFMVDIIQSPPTYKVWDKATGLSWFMSKS